MKKINVIINELKNEPLSDESFEKFKNNVINYNDKILKELMNNKKPIDSIAITNLLKKFEEHNEKIIRLLFYQLLDEYDELREYEEYDSEEKIDEFLTEYPLTPEEIKKTEQFLKNHPLPKS